MGKDKSVNGKKRGEMRKDKRMKNKSLAAGICILLLLTGCSGNAADTVGTTENSFAVNGTESNTNVSENTGASNESAISNSEIAETETTEEILEDDENIKDDMDSWLGRYEFEEWVNEEGSAPMFMAYDINIYKENNQYYADVEVNGQMTGINLRAKLYGNNEWVSLVINEYYPEHVTGLSRMENSVFISLRRQGDEVLTYWGTMIPLIIENEESGNVYLERKTEENIQNENTGEMDGLENWIGEYAFEESNEENEKMFYHLTVYEENGEYYADFVITGQETEINVKTQLYGDEQWASFILAENNSELNIGLDEAENEVLFSLRKQGEHIYTYWGIRELTKLMLNDSYLRYYLTHYYFEKVEG